MISGGADEQKNERKQLASAGTGCAILCITTLALTPRETGEKKMITHQCEDCRADAEFCAEHRCEHEGCDGEGTVIAQWRDEDGDLSSTTYLVCTSCMRAGSATGPGYVAVAQ